MEFTLGAGVFFFFTAVLYLFYFIFLFHFLWRNQTKRDCSVILYYYYYYYYYNAKSATRARCISSDRKKLMKQWPPLPFVVLYTIQYIMCMQYVYMIYYARVGVLYTMHVRQNDRNYHIISYIYMILYRYTINRPRRRRGLLFQRWSCALVYSVQRYDLRKRAHRGVIIISYW